MPAKQCPYRLFFPRTANRCRWRREGSHVSLAVLLLVVSVCSSETTASTVSFTESYMGSSNGVACDTPFNIVGAAPDDGLSHPVFVYTVGTGETFDNKQAMAAVRSMAAKGFVAATVQYSNGSFDNCRKIAKKTSCIFDPAQANSAINKLCTRGDCGKGIVVSGFSQGAIVATRAKDYDRRVRAAYGLGALSSYGRASVAGCMNDKKHELPASRLRIVNGESDSRGGGTATTVRRSSIAVTGKRCANNAFSCLNKNGSGWILVKNAQVSDRSADHCYPRRSKDCSGSESVVDSKWRNGAEPWGLQANLDWLKKFTNSSVGAPIFTRQPADARLELGRPATFTVNAAGAGALRYQWTRNNVKIPGAIGRTLTTSEITLDDVEDRFSVRVTSDLGSVTSMPAGLVIHGVSPGPETRDVGCADWLELDTPYGRITNNVWNLQGARGSSYRQCITVRGEGADRRFGWIWDWSGPDDIVFAYPETVIGWKPWNGGGSTHARLPIRIGNVKQFRWSYSTETAATGKYNLATSMWLTRSGKTGVFPNPSDISAEFMIWTDTVGFNPAGRRIATVVIDGLEFEVWYAADWGDASGTNANRWSYITYRSKSRFADASIDVHAMLLDAVQRGLVSANHYVSNIELGNEVMKGAGQTWLNALQLNVH